MIYSCGEEDISAFFYCFGRFLGVFRVYPRFKRSEFLAKWDMGVFKVALQDLGIRFAMRVVLLATGANAGKIWRTVSRFGLYQADRVPCGHAL